MALPQRTPEQKEQDNRIYVLPPWAQPARKKSGWEAFRDRVAESRTMELLRLEVKVILLAVVLLGMGFVGLKGLYRTKSEAGVEIAAPFHAPNLLPFLR